jgi:hypothetical protein
MPEPNDNNNGNNQNNQNPATGTNGSAQSGNGGSPPRQTVEATVAVRPERYLVAPRPLPGIQPMAADVILSTLSNMPDVRIVRRMQPRGFGAFAAGGGGTPEVVVAEMDPARGAALVASAGPSIIVERDALLRHADDGAISTFGNAMSMLPGPGVDVRLRIVSTSGRPLPKSTVYVYGLGFPAQGLTDDRGEVTVTVFGGPIETVQAVYIKPYADHWDRMVRTPTLSSSVNTLQLRPLSETYQGFPQTGMVGWGQRAMKLDQVAASLAGQGVKVGIIDSGCDNTHPQLTHVTRGVDLTNNRDAGSWINDTMSHGTHCAGIITAASAQLAGIRGFAPLAEVHALKVFPGGRFSDLLDALDQSIERQLDIVNMSLGSSEGSELVANKLAEARRSGVACIVAAGNASGPVQFPGVVPSVFTVSALGMLDQFPPDSYHAQTVVPGLVAGQMFSPKFTCFGPQVAVSGPGVAIVSTVPGGGYAAWDGTSMATPHVTGMGALLLAHHPLLRDGARARGEQRVAQLFALLANAGVRYLGDPTREGAGLPDLQGAGLAGMAQVANLQPAGAPIGPSLGAGNRGLLSFEAAPQFAAAAFQANPFGNAGAQLGAFSSGVPAGIGLNPALIQRLVQLRAAGLL